MIYTRKDLKKWIDYEEKIYGVRGIRKVIGLIFPISERDVLYKHQRLLRKYEYFINSKKPILRFIYQIIVQRYQNKYFLHIPPNTCGRGLRIMHVGPILINQNAKIGENCVLHINTAIVAGGSNHEAPVIGNGCVLGVGSSIVGKTNLGNAIAVGANSLVNKDFVEDDITIAGIPAKKISNGGATKWNV